MKTKHSFSYALISSLLAFSVLQGCSDDGDANPTPPDVTPSAGKSGGGSAGSGGNGNKAGSKATPEGGGGADGGAPTTQKPDGGQAGQGGEGPVEPTCDPLLGADDCFNCPKDGEVVQWLNRCVDSDCEPFDNSKTRLPLVKADGSLPALPN